MGVNEWNDRRDYRHKYENHSNVLRRKSANMLFVIAPLADIVERTILHDDLNFDNDETRITNRIFPETALAKNQFNADTYGYGVYGDECECCGKQTSCMDFASKYGLCDACNIRMEYDAIDLHGNHANLLSKIR